MPNPNTHAFLFEKRYPQLNNPLGSVIPDILDFACLFPRGKSHCLDPDIKGHVLTGFHNHVLDDYPDLEWLSRGFLDHSEVDLAFHGSDVFLHHVKDVAGRILKDEYSWAREAIAHNIVETALDALLIASEEGMRIPERLNQIVKEADFDYLARCLTGFFKDYGLHAASLRLASEVDFIKMDSADTFMNLVSYWIKIAEGKPGETQFNQLYTALIEVARLKANYPGIERAFEYSKQKIAESGGYNWLLPEDKYLLTR